MYHGILVTHSYIRYIILALLVIVIIVSVVGLVNKSPFTRRHDKLGLFLLMCAHTQLLLGVILYIVSLVQERRVQFTAETMKTPALRYFAVEHAVSMVIAVALITIARVSANKTPIDQIKHRRMLLHNTLALILIIGVVFILGSPYNTY